MILKPEARNVVTHLPQLLHLRATRIFLVALAVWLLIFQYGRFRYWRDPHSAFFSDRHVYDLDYSLHREREARHFIARYNTPSDPPESIKSGPDPLVCVSFVTVRRNLDDYFEPSIGSLLEGLEERERRALYLTVLFADTDPARHASWGQKWVDRVVDAAGTYNVSDAELDHLRELERDRNFYEKGVYDYIYALSSCQQSNAAYTIVFEDDIILATGWMTQTLKGLADIARIQTQTQTQTQTQDTPDKQDNGKDHWLYLRLFYTETSLSWESSDFAYRNMPLVFGLVMLSTFLGLSLLRRSRWGRTSLDYLTIAVICLACAPAFTALVYMMGKYNLMPLQGVVEMNQHGCCTQGMLYPRSSVTGLVQYLTERNNGQTDSMIEEYADQMGLTRYALAPPQLQHVGLKSSRDNLDINTQSTWAFWFEANDPDRLRREHELLLMDGDVQNMLDGH